MLQRWILQKADDLSTYYTQTTKLFHTFEHAHQTVKVIEFKLKYSEELCIVRAHFNAYSGLRPAAFG